MRLPVVEDQFLIGVLFTIYNLLIDPQRSRGLRAAAPWCVEHATLGSNSIGWILYTDNLLDAFLRLDMQIHLRKYRSICFEKIAPCQKTRSDFVQSHRAISTRAQLLQWIAASWIRLWRGPLRSSGRISLLARTCDARPSAQLWENFTVGEDLRCEAYASVLLFCWATFWSDGGTAGGGASWEDGQSILLRQLLRTDWGPGNPCSGL